jgi:hypothetical protein
MASSPESSPRRTNGHYDFAGLLRHYIEASLYTYGQLAQLSAVPKRTIVNWIDGTVKRPRHWQSVVGVASALRLSQEQTDELLAAADLPDLLTLAAESSDADDLTLLAPWQLEAAAGHISSYLHAYLRRLPLN